MPYGTTTDSGSEPAPSRPDLRDKYRSLALPAVVAAVMAKKAQPPRSDAVPAELRLSPARR